MSLLQREILIVTGKGGTGKTTVAAALGLWAARAGKRTLLVECNGSQQLPTLFGRSSEGYTPTRLHPGLSAMSITAEEAIEDYVVKQIKVRKLYRMVFRNRIMGPFMDVVPGLHDAVHLGKVYDLIEDDKTRGRPNWDLIIVDAPATGHGLLHARLSPFDDGADASRPRLRRRKARPRRRIRHGPDGVHPHLPSGRPARERNHRAP